MTIITKPPKLPRRPTEGHKGLFGRVLIVGGNEGMIGAPAFAGTAALRMGAGLVQVAVPRAILGAVLSICPEIIGLGLGKSAARLFVKAAEAADAIVIGPGLGKSPEALARLNQIIRLGKPTVIDADGLNLLAGQKRWPALFRAKAVLTPHPGEMKRLANFLGRSEVPTDHEGRIEIATAAAKAFRQLIVLKGHRTVVTDGDRVYLNSTGNSALSKAGTGDILSGILGCLLAQELDRFDAACIAVHLHGRAGEIAGQRVSMRSALASDVLDAISAAAEDVEGEPF